MGSLERIFLNFTAFCCKTKKRTIILNGGFLLILLYTYYQRDLLLFYIERSQYTYIYFIFSRVISAISTITSVLALTAIAIMLIIFIFSLLFDIKYKVSKKEDSYTGENLTIIVPCYNEGDKLPKTIERLSRLKSINKTKITIIFVNDGSVDFDDETLRKIKSIEKTQDKYDDILMNRNKFNKISYKELMKYYSSLESPREIKNKAISKTLQVLFKTFNVSNITTNVDKKFTLPHKPIQAIYYDKINDVYIIDKKNGGKFDALNAGINLCKTKWVLVLDADTIIGDNTIDKCLSNANSDTEIIYPPIVPMYKKKSVLTVSQLFNYLSSFYIVRQGMSLYNGNVIVSGAVGFFTIDFLVETNGYFRTVGEDAHKTLDFHFRNLVRTHYKIKPKKMIFIPDADACFTFAFEKYKGLNSQQNRWMRALLQVIGYMKSITKLDKKKLSLDKARNVNLNGERSTLKDYICIFLLKLSHLYYNLIEIFMQFTMPLNITILSYLFITKQFSSLLFKLQCFYFFLSVLFSFVGLIKFALYQKKLSYLLYIPFTPLSIFFYIAIYPSKIKAYVERKSLSWGR